MWSNNAFVLSVWYIFSIETKTKKKRRKSHKISSRHRQDNGFLFLNELLILRILLFRQGKNARYCTEVDVYLKLWKHEARVVSSTSFQFSQMQGVLPECNTLREKCLFFLILNKKSKKKTFRHFVFVPNCISWYVNEPEQECYLVYLPG